MWSYPLQWPLDWPRTTYRQNSAFGTTLHKAYERLGSELQKLGAKDLIVTSNLQLGRSGSPLAPRSGSSQPADPGVAVYFTRQGDEVCIPCDKWTWVEDNLHAIELTLGALRGIERWGAKEMMDRAFSGYAALPAASSAPAVAWWTVLELDPNASREEIQSAYRRLARRTHPDTPTGSVDQFKVLQAAYEQALAVA
jgi:hypothetical protein